MNMGIGALDSNQNVINIKNNTIIDSNQQNDDEIMKNLILKNIMNVPGVTPMNTQMNTQIDEDK